MPSNRLESRGLGLNIKVYVDAIHTEYTITRWLRNGFIVYLNNTPVNWLSKKQNSVEISFIGFEFIAMKHCCKYLRGLQYRLCMMGIPCNGPSYIFSDSLSVFANTTCLNLTLKKKSQSIMYYFVRQDSARDEWKFLYDNPSDLLTNVLSVGEKRQRYVRMILHQIFGTVD